MNVFKSLKYQINDKVFSKVATLAKVVWPPESILSGEVCQDIELTLAEQQALPWFSASHALLPAGKAVDSRLWDTSKIAFEYEMPVSHWIQSFKYHTQVERGRLLADLFAKHFKLTTREAFLTNQSVEVLIPVPMHRQRYRQRGFNQSLRLAKRLSSLSGIPVINKAVKRVRNTPPQAKLDAKQRHKNLCNAFELDVSVLQNIRRIALVDDVVTTGATMNEIVKLIREQTAVEWIEVWAIAQA